MKRVAILSDTHGKLPDKIVPYLHGMDLILHAGDIGNVAVLEQLQKIAPTVAVYGNIDDASVRRLVPEVQRFYIEEASVLMMHIGGYPGRYTAQARRLIVQDTPHLFVSGHSHILKIMPDRQHPHLLHINPGAVGFSGWHPSHTVVRLSIEGTRLFDLEVVDLPRS
jgi:hypothetical protein